MSTTAPAGVNGRARKSLEHQLNRLDSILDGLAEALNGAVADAVKDAVGVAVKEAVRAVVNELLTNPAVVTRVAEAHGLSRQPEAELPETPEPKTPSWRERMRARWRGVRSAAASAKNWAVAMLAGGVRKVGSSASVVARLAAASRKNTAAAVGVGLLVGVGCYLCGPVVASVVGGAVGAATAFVVRLLRPVWPLVRMAVPCQPSRIPTAWSTRSPDDH